VGKLTAFLCSDDGANITRQVIALDGGSSVKGGA
jgi:enoyl-[acyl-carrier-protein] reductase (NADH)